MSSGSAALLTDVGHPNYQNALATVAKLPRIIECSSEPGDDEKQEYGEQDEDEDEEEDLDFNPFLKETPTMEASSSLSSEIEGLDANVVDSGGSNSAPLVATSLSKAPNQMIDYDVGDGKHGEEVVQQTTVTSEVASKTVGEKFLSNELDERKSVLISKPEHETINEKDNSSSSGTDVVNDVVIGDFNTASRSTRSSMNIDDEDAICRRTRARYSLVSFTLDELETFLQETDDEGDLQNVDDEEEYRKFLAAVLHDVDTDHSAQLENENIDEEDDNDADFELEIEEALESDVDENITGKTQEQDFEAGGRRPETRQNKRQKASGRLKKKNSGQLNRPLRPLLPNVPVLPLPAVHGKNMMLERAPHGLSSSVCNGFVNGFTPHQFGQLHYLIYEHVQLLIQVFSLCVFEPSKEHIAAQVQGLISEMLQKRNQVLTGRRVPYPSFCFCPPFIHPSVQDEPRNTLPTQNTFQSSSIYASQRDCCFGNNMVQPSDIIHPCNERHEYVSSGTEGHFQSTEGPFWMPSINGHVLSILDVAPLNVVGSYMEDVSSAVQEYKGRHVGETCDTCFDKEPLFPFQSLLSSAGVNDEVSRGSQALNLMLSSQSDQGPRKTLAGTLVERTKKQSVAPVPKNIAKLAQVFFPLFNPALFPHKPPPATVANRVLFTDAEDMLLAMGLMEYNTDWKAIQQHFLPCKSKHQIFVRQKNRTCSRAPENPIKAVRRIKNSPLTAEETARIREGLKIFKLDWMSVWKFVVPYRDPSLLPRQWRIAIGTQKSYKVDGHRKEKRRLYEAKRRKCKPAALGRWHSSSEKEDSSAGGENNSGEDCINNENQAYVHEAFLADWRPGTSSLSLELPASNFAVKDFPSNFLSQGSNAKEQMNNSGSGDLQHQINQPLTSSSNYSHPLASSHFTNARVCASSSQLNNPFSGASLNPSKSQPLLPPYRARRTSSPRTVKLAPDLPPVNLPPSVRVMSASAFKNYQGGAFNKVSCAQDGFAGPGKPITVPKFLYVSNSATSNPRKVGHNNSNPATSTTHLHPKESVFGNKQVTENKEGSDLYMHPLLFQPPEDGHLPYFPLNCSTSASSSFNIFPRNQPLLNLSLFHNPKQANYTANFFDKSLKSKEKSSPSFGIDFHPLLQRSDDINSNSVTACPTAPLSPPSELLGAQHAQRQVPFDPVLAKSGSVATLATPSSPNGKTNELDLDIHLSFTSGKEISGESRDAVEQNMTREPASAQESGIIETQYTANSLNHSIESSPRTIPAGINKKIDSGAHALVRSNSDVNRNSISSTRNQSLPEIVMEQEELSDSEDEVGEHVEFECEEMADSEGEGGFDSEQIGAIEIEELPNVAEDKVPRDADCNDQQHEPKSLREPNYNVGFRSEGSNVKLAIKDQEKDNPSSSLCLSLNSCLPPASQFMKPNLSVARKNPRGSAGKKQVTSRLNRSCKNTAPSTKHVTPHKHGADMLQQPNLDSVDVTPARKPRKRARRANSSLNADQAKKGDESCSTGPGVESVDVSNPVNNNDRS